jgi:hypothetical protein
MKLLRDGGWRQGSLLCGLFVLGFFVRPKLEDKERQEEAILQSRLDWTIVRQLRYTDEPRRGDYRMIGDGGGRVGKTSCWISLTTAPTSARRS